MLDNWLSPITDFEINDLGVANPIEKNIVTYKDQFPSLKGINLALISIDEDMGTLARQFLYAYQRSSSDIKIADLGNLRKVGHNPLIQVSIELISSGILPIFIGIPEDYPMSLLKSFEHLANPYSVLLTESDANSLRRLHYLNENGESFPFLHKIITIAYQRHLLDKKSFSDPKYDFYGLGSIRTSKEQLEPLIRDADLFYFNLNALANHILSLGTFNPSGLTSEESCQIARYAGMSDNLKALVISGLDNDSGIDSRKLQANFIAQFLWYFVEGYQYRLGEFPDKDNSLVKYVVHVKDLDCNISFLRSRRSGRWWMQLPLPHGDLGRHSLVPCSQVDYQQASQGEMPDRLFNELKRLIHH